MIDAVLLTGTVGAGKTATALSISARLERARVLHAVVDLDQLRLLRPPPPGDPFQHVVEIANLRDVACNYRRAGARRLIVAGVVDEADAVREYCGALGAERLLVVRLTVEPAVAAARLRARHRDDAGALRWHLERTDPLAATIEAAGFADASIDTTALDTDEVASRVEALAGW